MKWHLKFPNKRAEWSSARGIGFFKKQIEVSRVNRIERQHGKRKMRYAGFGSFKVERLSNRFNQLNPTKSLLVSFRNRGRCQSPLDLCRTGELVRQSVPVRHLQVGRKFCIEREACPDEWQAPPVGDVGHQWFGDFNHSSAILGCSSTAPNEYFQPRFPARRP